MWGRKDQESLSGGDPPVRSGVPKQQSGRPDTTSAAAGAQPSPTQNAAPQRKVSAPVSSRIGKSVRFKGEIHSEEDLFIDGIVEGLVSIPKNVLIIGSNSQVNADVHAHSLILHGMLNGEVTVVERIEIKKTGSLHGNLVTHRIVIENGGMFRGSCDTRSPEGSKPGKPVARAKRTVTSASVQPAEAAPPVAARKVAVAATAGRN